MTKQSSDLPVQGKLINFPQDHIQVSSEVQNEQVIQTSSETVDLEWERMCRELSEEMELGIRLSCENDPATVNEIIRKRREARQPLSRRNKNSTSDTGNDHE